ncbi:hypothetical protein BD560DRAFT_392941, partial [Blakeslea trispora]
MMNSSSVTSPGALKVVLTALSAIIFLDCVITLLACNNNCLVWCIISKYLPILGLSPSLLQSHTKSLYLSFQNAEIHRMSCEKCYELKRGSCGLTIYQNV